MKDLPPLPSSRNSSRAPARQSSSPDLTETHSYIRDFFRENRQRLNFTSIQLPILDDHQLSSLSDGETALVPLSCSTLNALASMTRQLDTITTQLGNIQATVATLPTWPALEGTLASINTAIRDLSHRVSAPPSQAPAPTRAHVPRPVSPHNPRQPPLGLLFVHPVPPHTLPPLGHYLGLSPA